MSIEHHFRVWCLSWDEEEEDGYDVIPYDVVYGEPPPKRPGALFVSDIAVRDAADAVEAYAEYVHDKRDAHESTWPLAFRVRSSDGSLVDFEVEREYHPQFCASAPLSALVPTTHLLWGSHLLCEDLRLHRVPGQWPTGQRWMSLKDVADGAEPPPDRCERCWKRAPSIIEGMRQIGARVP